MLSTVGRHLDGSSCEWGGLRKLSAKKNAVPNDARFVFFRVAAWFPFFGVTFPLSTPPSWSNCTLYYIIVPFVVKNHGKTHKNIQHTFQKDETIVGSMLMSSSPRPRVGIPKLQWRFPMEATSHDLQKCFQAPRRKWSSHFWEGCNNDYLWYPMISYDHVI